MGGAEAYYINDGPSGEGKGLYLGGAFNPLGVGHGSGTPAELKVKEIKNGRYS